MSSRIFYFILCLTILVVVESYAFQAIRTLSRNKWIYWIWIVLTLAIYINLFVQILTAHAFTQSQAQQWAIGLVFLTLIPKIVIMLMLFGEDIIRYFLKIFSFFPQNDVKPLAGRRKFISQLAIGLASIPFAGILYGITKGKYNYKVLKYKLSFPDLPQAFNGFTITQISDIHSGSFTNEAKISYGIDLINAQESDLILFTGDIVNNKADEMNKWITLFSKLKAKNGKYSILGNHDYGDYVHWENKEAKEDNFKAIKSIHSKIGFKLLLNENTIIEKEGQHIAIIGVENWGKGFRQAGDLDKASKGISNTDFKILLSHDPTHWEYKIKNDQRNFQLTLSGHTHGTQFGIEIPGFVRWSPAQYIYKQWAGIYQNMGRYLNVNRGFGYHAFPGRVGIWPEITVITLYKS